MNTKTMGSMLVVVGLVSVGYRHNSLMGMTRKGNPLFRQGVDVLGRKAWLRKRMDTGHNAVGLRAGLSVEASSGTPESDLKPQLSPVEMAILFSEAREFGYRSTKRSDGSHPDDVMIERLVLGIGGVATSLGALVFAPIVAAPIIVGTAAALLVPVIRKRLRRRSVEGMHIDERVLPHSTYRNEARRLVEEFPHRNGTVPAFKQKAGTGNKFRMHKVRYSVDSLGVGEVKWKRFYAGSGVKESEGTLFFYPGVNLGGMEIPFPLRVPNVNMRHAVLRGVVLDKGGTMDGGDFRGVEAPNSTWRKVSLRGASFAGANLSGAYLPDCDMSGVDLTGADVTDAKLPEDLTETNITREQFESLLGVGGEGEGISYRVKEVAFDEVVTAFGGDSDAVTVAMWAGDIEVRDRNTSKVVIGEYNPDTHYIPRWSLDAASYA